MSSFERARDWLTDAEWLNTHLDERWHHDPIQSVRTVRIGEGFGLSGEVYRLHVDICDRRQASLVAKIESVDKIRTAIAVRHHVEAELGASMPRCLGAHLEPGNDGDELGVILMEDIAPAQQGDDLEGATPRQVIALTGVIRRLHGLTVPNDPDVDRWRPRERDPDLWQRRLVTLRERHADQFTPSRWERLERLDEDAHSASTALEQAPARWIHVDPHFDNVLWRPDGSAVLLDWSNARQGPVALDLAVLVSSSCFGATPAFSDPDELLDVYARSGGGPPDSEQLRLESALALTVLLRGMLGWLARDDLAGAQPRELALRLSGIGRVNRGIDWIDHRR